MSHNLADHVGRGVSLLHLPLKTQPLGLLQSLHAAPFRHQELCIERGTRGVQ